jgi:hypothetical protein
MGDPVLILRDRLSAYEKERTRLTAEQRVTAAKVRRIQRSISFYGRYVWFRHVFANVALGAIGPTVICTALGLLIGVILAGLLSDSTDALVLGGAAGVAIALPAALVVFFIPTTNVLKRLLSKNESEIARMQSRTLEVERRLSRIDSETETTRVEYRKSIATIENKTKKDSPVAAAVKPEATPAELDFGPTLPVSMKVSCPCCRAKVSQTADRCPQCGHKFDRRTMAGMKKDAVFAQTLTAVVAFFMCGIFVLVMISCSGMLHRSGLSGVSSSTKPSYSPDVLSEDEFVHQEMLKSMSESDYQKTERFRNYWHSRGLTDDQIRTVINDELRKRGE